MNQRRIPLSFILLCLFSGPIVGCLRLSAQEPGSTIAYQVPAGTVGNQNFIGPFGMDFDVGSAIRVHRLGIFDADSDGLTVPLTVYIYDRNSQALLASVEFTPAEPGALIGGSRFKELAAPLDLVAGFEGVIAADGFMASDLAGNTGVGDIDGLSTDDGPVCSIRFVGTSRFGVGGPGTFPANPDGGPANRYAAGTFEFEPLETEPGGIAYGVPVGTEGGQDFGGNLGHDFDVVENIEITRLGVFDSASDGLNRTITARLYDRDTMMERASLIFTAEEPGELVGGSRFKALSEPLLLQAGFRGVIAAAGYGADELLGNQGAGSLGLFADSGACLIEFLGSGRFSVDPSVFPATVNGGSRVNPFAAGTFEFQPPEVVVKPPLPPTDLAVVAGDTEVTLTWAAPVGGAAVAGYNVIQTAPGPEALLNVTLVTETQFVASGLLNGAQHCFVVVAVGEEELVSERSDGACATPTSGVVPEASQIAYQVAAGVAGNQTFGGSLGMDFRVRSDIIITRLGVFDSAADGLASTLTARLFADGGVELASLAFTAEDPGELVGGSRFKDLPVPVELPAGFAGTISAEGYGELEPNGNQNVAVGGGQPLLDLGVDDGGCAIAFRGARFGDPGTFPVNVDTIVAPHQYAAGTFMYGSRPGASPPPPEGGIAYGVPEGSVGNQEFGGALGMDFNTLQSVRITALGVFDSGSDGLAQTITARLYERDGGGEIANLVFTPEDPGDLVGGSRFKALDPPITLPAGFHGVIAASGYGAGEPFGNGVPPGRSTNDGGCLLLFVGSARFGVDPAAFPSTPDGGPANRYAAGTFRFEAAPGALQVAGDCNQDGSRDVGDVICYIGLQFPGYILGGSPAALPCDEPNATDPGNLGVLNVNGDDGFDVSDIIFLANFLFGGGSPPVQGVDCFALDGSSVCENNLSCQ